MRESDGAEVVKVPLTAAIAHDLAKMGSGGALVYICNPNNPTGTITPKAALRVVPDALPRDTSSSSTRPTSTTRPAPTTRA